MVPTNDAIRGQPGDMVIVEGHRVGESRRLGEILEALGTPVHQHDRVRWEDGHETVYYPSSDATIQAAKRTKEISELASPTDRPHPAEVARGAAR